MKLLGVWWSVTKSVYLGMTHKERKSTVYSSLLWILDRTDTTFRCPCFSSLTRDSIVLSFLVGPKHEYFLVFFNEYVYVHIHNARQIPFFYLLLCKMRSTDCIISEFCIIVFRIQHIMRINIFKIFSSI